MDIKGLTVEKVLVTPKIEIAEEYYLGVVLDRASQAPVAIVSAAGGVDIEQVAEEAPEKIIRRPIDVRWGLLPLDARNMLAEAGVPHTVVAEGGAILSALARAFMETDANLAEINPLALTEGRPGDGRRRQDRDRRQRAATPARIRQPGPSRRRRTRWSIRRRPRG